MIAPDRFGFGPARRNPSSRIPWSSPHSMSSSPDDHLKTVIDGDNYDQLEDTVRFSIGQPVLIVLARGKSESNGRRHYTIDPGERVIGRDPMCDIALNDVRCSRRHAKIVCERAAAGTGLSVRLEDMGSTNGVFVNGHQVTRHTLKDNDRVLVGSTMMGYFIRDHYEVAVEQHLYNMACTDALSGLQNRRAFDIELQCEYQQARRFKHPLSLVLFDIDHFKRLNDTYGHQIGDSIIQEIGRLVMANIRTHDLGARYGGDELALVLPETDLQGAQIQAERLRAAVAEHQFGSAGTPIHVSISVGVAQVEPATQSAAALIEAADQALYRAKQAGRNRVCWSFGGVFGVVEPNDTQ